MLNNFNKFTNRLNHVLDVAKLNASQLNKKEIDLEDLLLALAQVKGGLAKEILEKSGFSLIVLNNNQTDNLNKQKVDYSLKAKKALEKASYLAADLGHNYVGTEHLLFSLLEIDSLNMEKVLIKYKVDSKKIIVQLRNIFKSTNAFESISGVLTDWHQLANNLINEDLNSDNLSEFDLGLEEEKNVFAEKETLKAKKNKINKRSTLEIFAKNLTDENFQKNIDPLIGRETEINRLIQILLRRNKNNPVLLGDPGVGKTAIVEGLAKKILLGNVPDFLLDKKIYALDLSLLIAGTMMRGEFESRLKQILEEVKNHPEIILFIDELHTIVGAGSTPGSMDAANILKPALARGELRCIGATTFTEYKKHIEDDAALERRFQAIKVAEPTTADTIKILAGIKINYEKHHLVKISDEAIETAVRLSERYLPEKFFPDKAIDLLDEAASMVKIELGSVNEELRKLRYLQAKLKDLEQSKEALAAQEKYNEALKIKDLSDNLIKEINNLTTVMTLGAEKPNFLGEVGVSDVAKVVANLTGVPLENLIATNEKNIDLFKVLSQKIVGQDEVLKELSFCLKRAQAGLAGRNRPLGSFMFLGGTGVGKTETAKILAEEFFRKENKHDALIRFDMSEFAESFNVSRLIGSPAGYVGYKEGGRLTEAVRRNPYSVILFDEIEKAHREVFNILLQILDSGFLTDATGKKVDFKNTVIILTSNLGSRILDRKKFGFEVVDNKKIINSNPNINIDDYLKEVKDKFPPEFLSRLDKILIFNQLDLKITEKIVDLQLKDLAENLKLNKNISLFWSKKIRLELAKIGFSSDKGARNIRQNIEQIVENKLADEILAGNIKNGQNVTLAWLNSELKINLK